jgi:predicted amidophosphoribosyltransferase
MTIELKGNWKRGFAHDVHTLSSVYMGVDDKGMDYWDTTRTHMGELVYRLKYRQDTSTVQEIVDMLERYRGLDQMDAIVTTPPTNKSRRFQPVIAIARELGDRINVPVFPDALEIKNLGPELKNIDSLEERIAILTRRMFAKNTKNLEEKNILLIDDLYRSGSTLFVATDILYTQAKVREVFVLTMTKTRSKT